MALLTKEFASSGIIDSITENIDQMRLDMPEKENG